jgi:DNA-binding NtrC family response regulator
VIILLVEDEPDIRQSLSKFITKLGHTVVCAKDGMSGLKTFHERRVDLVITDIRMPGMDGLELLRHIKKIELSPVDIIVITGHGDMDNAITALKLGAFDYLQKPINVRELAITIERSQEYASLRSQYIRLKKDFQQQVEQETRAIQGEAEQLRKAYLQEMGLDELCVYSDAMREVVRQTEKYSSDRSICVLIEGESGTGKELIANYIHHYAQKNHLSPFVAVNCGAMSPELFEAELFGHESGAYTGATQTGRIGKLEAASSGTLFLDEIGEMPFQLQVKLLRVMEEGKLFRVGGVNPTPIDVRFLCATNKSLKHEVQEKRFRLDLYYRISSGSIHVPPLRERREDILPLAYRFITHALSRKGKPFVCFTKPAEKFLYDFSWPGNVRQLKNTMGRLALMKADGVIEMADLAFIRDDSTCEPKPPNYRLVLGCDHFDLPEERLDFEAFNNQIIQKALAKHNGNQTDTAAYFGISRRALQGRIKKMKGPR